MDKNEAYALAQEIVRESNKKLKWGVTRGGKFHANESLMNNWLLAVDQNARGWCVKVELWKSNGHLAVNVKVIQLGKNSTEDEAKAAAQNWIDTIFD